MNEELKLKIKKELENNGFIQLLGMEILEMKEGYARGMICMNKTHMNQYKGMHGGCIYSLADTIAGVAAISYGNMVSTIDGKMDYLEPASNTEHIYCEAKVVRQGKKVAVYETFVTNDAGKLLAKADFTYFVMDKNIQSITTC